MKKAQDPLDILDVINKMEIGPVKVEKNRIISPYKVIQDGKISSFDLIYRYQEDVFNPDEPQSVNLADMIAAQVAINYGLFCREMVFIGHFDKVDQKFIKDMMENTAREIFVKKFIEHNPFLVGDASHLSPVKRHSYLQARVVFEDSASTSLGEKVPPSSLPWKTDHSLHAVLSSGGKDSLLSFGLLREIKDEVHPIFINESGRHWFTALNGYCDTSPLYVRTFSTYARTNIPSVSGQWLFSFSVLCLSSGKGT